MLTCTLGNGAELLSLHTPGLHSGVISAHIRVGSRFETLENAGISHFLEHMLCRGTARHPSAHALALAFESVAGTLSAATMVDHGSLGVALPEDGLEAVLPLFWDAFHAPLLEGIEVERGIVEEEILEQLDEAGRQIDGDNLVRALCFGDHPLGFPITGTIEHLQRFDQPRLRAHHAAHYTGACTVITLAGPWDPEHALRRAAELFGQLETGAAPAAAPPPEQHEPRFRFVKNPGSQTALRIAFRAIGRHDPFEPATDMLLRVLDDGMSTRLYHQICDERGLCYDIAAGYEGWADVGLFDVQADTLHERTGEVLAETLNVLAELREHGPTEAELDKARRRVAWELRALADDVTELAEFYAGARILGTTASPEARQAQLLAVTREDVRAAAERTFRASGINVVAVGLLPRRARERLEAAVRSF